MTTPGRSSTLRCTVRDCRIIRSKPKNLMIEVNLGLRWDEKP
jgi:hypothetical protein